MDIDAYLLFFPFLKPRNYLPINKEHSKMTLPWEF